MRMTLLFGGHQSTGGAIMFAINFFAEFPHVNEAIYYGMCVFAKAAIVR